MTQWNYIESSEKNLAMLRSKMNDAIDFLDNDAVESLTTHFVLMKMALTGLRGHAGDLAPDDMTGISPVKMAVALTDLADHLGVPNSQDHLRQMYEESYVAVLRVLIATGHMGDA